MILLFFERDILTVCMEIKKNENYVISDLRFYEIKPIFSNGSDISSKTTKLTKFPKIRKSKEHDQILTILENDRMDTDGIIVFQSNRKNTKLKYRNIDFIYDALKGAEFCAMFEIDNVSFGENYIYLEVGTEHG